MDSIDDGSPVRCLLIVKAMACLAMGIGGCASSSKTLAQAEWVERPDVAFSSPEALAQRQLQGYNKQDIEMFLEPYSEDVRVYSFPDTLLFTSKDEMRRRYTKLFSSRPMLRCELIDRVVLGNVVIDHERVTGLSENSSAEEVIAIYRVSEGQIVAVYFVTND